jgi:hypothetical protein
MKKCIWYFIATILMFIEFPFVILTTIFGLITWVFNNIHVKIHQFMMFIKRKLNPFNSENECNVEIMGNEFADWTKINNEPLTRANADALAKKYENKGYKTYISFQNNNENK